MLIRSSLLVTAMTVSAGAAVLAFPAAASTLRADPPPLNHCDTTTCTAGGTRPGRDGEGQGPPGSAPGTIVRDPCNGDPLCATGDMGTPPPAAITAADVVLRAQAQMERPLMKIQTSPRTRTYVGLRTFLWVDPGQWQPEVTTVSEAGFTVVGTSTPVEVVWNLGEKTITCTGPGTPYDPKGPENQRSTCTHVYEKSSADQAGGEYQISATVNWHVTYTCEPNCADGDLGMVPGLGAVEQLPVGEIQTGSRSG
ncbi:hypothetical protein [Actinomadura sp. HBU206391]|uniref:hypothetical protein n=1 Tax=Actinomadura sp. HBU206391 TaxID=2731692 RepID=UPI001650987F|nr:hypothetical protein [Actinomadura sp. HBU206391]MBC6457793.1 hypothetical protein [Actinomadura sp. HBU206391]